MKRLVKLFVLTIAWSIIAFAILLGIFKALTPLVSEHTKDIEHHISKVLGKTVLIESIETSWYGLQPVLKLKKISIIDNKQVILSLEEMIVGVRLFKSIWEWQLHPGILSISSLNITLIENQLGYRLQGINLHSKLNNSFQHRFHTLADWLLAQHKVIFKRLSIIIVRDNKPNIELHDVNLKAINQYGVYGLQANGQFNHMQNHRLKLLGHVYIDENDFEKIQGQLYVLIKDFELGQLKTIFPDNFPITFTQGLAHTKLWIDIKKGQLQKAVGHTHLENTQLISPFLHDKMTLKKTYATFTLSNTPKKLTINIEKLKFKANDNAFKKQNLHITYDKQSHAYHGYLNKFDIKKALTLPINWPSIIENIPDFNPHGYLHHISFDVENNKLSKFWMLFNDIGWNAAHNKPGVQGLFGVVQWTPKTIKVSIDSQNVRIHPWQKKPFDLDTFNTQIEYAVRDNKKNIHLKSLVLKSQLIDLKALGTFTTSVAYPQKYVNFQGEFKGNHLEQLLTYLPESYFDPKFNHWLKNDIYRIEKTRGDFIVKGDIASATPFNNEHDLFQFQADISGADILTKKDWPKTQNIKAHLLLDKSSLDIHLKTAKVLDIPLKDWLVTIRKLGSDDEMISVSGQLQSTGDKLLNYLSKTPLKEKMTRLSMIQLVGDVCLKLSLFIPVTTKPHHLAVNGLLVFNQNELALSHQYIHPNIKSLAGSLSFDEMGMTEGQLKGYLHKQPILIDIKSYRVKNPYTLIDISTQSSIQALKETLKLPILNYMRGDFALNSTLKLTDNPHDLDNMTFESDLEHVSIALPFPFHKESKDKKNLKVSIDFNMDKAVQADIRYADILSTQLWFKKDNQQFDIDKGTIRFGAAKALMPTNDGIQVIGTIPLFDVDQWNKVITNIRTENNSSTCIEKLRFLDLTFSSIRLGDITIPNLNIKATNTKQQSWSIDIKQENIGAHVVYQISQKLLSGTIYYLNLSRQLFSHKSNSNKQYFTPSSLPNMDLNIVKLNIDKQLIGEIFLKAKTKDQQWFLNKFHLIARGFELFANGEWKVENQKNDSKLDVLIQISNLKQGLNLLALPSRIDASKGELNFKLKWPASFFSPSLKDVKGQVAMSLHHGRISHLNHDTEQKIGIGKMLSILSLQTIPRRLRLDFSDLSHDGYSFDVLKGHFRLNQGVLSTQNSTIDGPVAYAKINGNIDIINKNYDLTLNISPHVTASLPLVATIAGGPIAGVATYVLNKIVTHGMKKVNAYTYTLKGPWSEPAVKHVSTQAETR